jgi:hypothetical protein
MLDQSRSQVAHFSPIMPRCKDAITRF